MNFPRVAAVATAFALLAAPASRAAVWTGGAPSGRLLVTVRYQGNPEAGRFRSFRVRLVTRHGRPVLLRVTVRTASFTLGSSLLDSAVRGQAWFDTAANPRAVYTARRFTGTDGHGRVLGTLRLKGVARPVILRWSLIEAGAGLVLKGTGTVNRLVFGIGTGSWARTDLVGRRVGLRFDVPLVPAAR